MTLLFFSVVASLCFVYSTVCCKTVNITREVIYGDSNPPGPYNIAIRVGNTMYNSGRLGAVLEPPGIVPGGIIPEMRETFKGIMGVLKAGRLNLNDVVKVIVYLTDWDWDDYAEMNEAYSKYFTGNCPARSVVQVKMLPQGARVFIEVISVDSENEAQ